MKEYKLIYDCSDDQVSKYLNDGWVLHSVTPLFQKNYEMAYHFTRTDAQFKIDEDGNLTRADG